MVNIMYLIEDLFIGGSEEDLLTILKGLNRERFNPLVICLAMGGPLVEEIKELGVEVKIIGLKRKFDLNTLWKLVRLMKERKIHILHTHLFVSDAYGRVAARIAGVPVILICMQNTYFWKRKRHIWLDRTLSRFTDRIICCSEVVREFTIEQERIRADKFVTVHNMIDLAKFARVVDVVKVKRDLGLNPETPIVGCVAILGPQKGHCYLLEAAAILLRRIPQTKFLIVGDGPLRRRLEGMAGDLGIGENILFLGNRRDTPQLFAAFDLSVLASLWEGLAIVLLEAMAMRKPIVATAVGGVPEVVVNQQTGILVPSKDPTSLAQAMLSLLKDRNKAREMGEAGRKRVEEKFSSKIMIKRLEDLYLSLLREKGIISELD